MYQEEVNSKKLINLYFFFKLYSSVADPKRFDADPDPTFQADANPDPNLFSQGEEFFSSSKSSTIVSKISQNLSCVIFSVKMREEG